MTSTRQIYKEEKWEKVSRQLLSELPLLGTLVKQGAYILVKLLSFSYSH